MDNLKEVIDLDKFFTVSTERNSKGKFNTKVNGVSVNADTDDVLDIIMRAMRTSQQDVFVASNLYKVIFNTLDFSSTAVQEAIDKGIDESYFIPLDKIHVTLLQSLLTMEGGYHALRLLRYVEGVGYRNGGGELVKSLIKKFYPRINKYVKVERVIRNNFYDSAKAIRYNLNLQIPENRMYLYLLACLLVDDFIPLDVSPQNSFDLNKLQTSVITCNAVVDFDDRDDFYSNMSRFGYQSIPDDNGFYNADLPGDVTYTGGEPYRELKNRKVNTSAKELKSALIKEFSINSSIWDDPYNVIYNEFRTKHTNLDYSTLPEFVRTYPLAVGYSDITNILCKQFSPTERSLPEGLKDLAVDMTMRHMGRLRLGVKTNRSEILDYLSFIMQVIRSSYLRLTHAMTNAVRVGDEASDYFEECKYLQEQLQEALTKQSEDAQLISDLQNRNQLLQTDVSKKDKELESLRAEIDRLTQANQSLQGQLEHQEQDYNKSIEEMATSLEEYKYLDSLPQSLPPVQSLAQELSKYNLVLIGAKPDFEQKLTTLLPITCISMTEAKQARNTVYSADYCILDVSFTSHPERYAVTDIYHDINFIYPPQRVTNLQIWMHAILQKIQEQQSQQQNSVRGF